MIVLNGDYAKTVSRSATLRTTKYKCQWGCIDPYTCPLLITPIKLFDQSFRSVMCTSDGVKTYTSVSFVCHREIVIGSAEEWRQWPHSGFRGRSRSAWRRLTPVRVAIVGRRASAVCNLADWTYDVARVCVLGWRSPLQRSPSLCSATSAVTVRTNQP